MKTSCFGGRLLAMAGALLATMAALPPAVAAGPIVAAVVDHHLHLGSPALSDFIAAVDKQDPKAFEHLSREIFSRPTPADALHALDEAGVKRAVLLAPAYLYVPGNKVTTSPEIARRVREENRFTVDAALASHGRFVAFVGINPFDPNAQKELDYWKGKPGVSGIKLHLGGADFHASSPWQVAVVAKFFAEARKARLPLVVHLRGAGPFPKQEVEIFIAKVLSQAGDLPVQIAHGGGYAGADPATIDSLTAFGEAIARHAPGTRNLVLDLSGVVLPDDEAKAMGSSDAQLQRFVQEMRKIGLDRFVMGSDWPATGPIAPYYALMRAKLPVTDTEWARLCANLAPYMRGIR